MTDEKRKAMKNLAVAVMSNFQDLDESEVVGRVMLLSGRNFKRCSEGYLLLIGGGFIPESFIRPETRGKFLSWIAERPALAELFDRLDLVPGKMTISEKTGEAVVETFPRKQITVEEVSRRLNLAGLDF